MLRKTLLAVAAMLVLGVSIAAAGPGDPISETAKTGPYTVTLKVLPAESFAGPGAAMAWDGGAEPVDLNAAAHPNHHLVAFVVRDGKPVENAVVTIRYREVNARQASWVSVPVARMHEAGKSLATTHYGNNVDIAPGRYAAEVTVNGGRAANFVFVLAPVSASE